MSRFSHRFFHKRMVMGALLLGLILMVTACGGQKPQGGEDQKKKQETKKALDLLDDLEAQNEKIMQALNGPAATEEGQQGGGQQKQGSGKAQGGDQQKQGSDKGQGGDQPQNSDQPQSSDQPKSSDQPQGGDQQKQGGDQQKQGGDQQKSQQDQGGQAGQDILKQGSTPGEQEWKQVNDSVIQLHTMLNEYLPMAMQQGVSQDLNNNITDTLNRLTIEAESKKHLEAMLQSNALSNYLSDLYALHQDKRAPIKKIRFHARNILLAGLVADWKSTNASIGELKGIWDMQKASFTEKDKEAVGRIDLAIRDLQDVIAQQNQNLVKIKGNLLITNLSELEKSAKEE